MIPISRKMIILNKHKMVNIHKLSIQKVILELLVQTRNGLTWSFGLSSSPSRLERFSQFPTCLDSRRSRVS